ncbi:HNH endonuclease signature motif containing protein [Gordonia aquimaris]|uniref:HNH endonuclease signature motif containing protein n=1 Tax=Gordonia aquimaris TaxID=2984863 RepID=A0A9X3D0W3_9ACTN|nr:HNH endonuclease signature motif containing protein [Gordonia aquimaris]MCX2962870.1 HNH endonuclease signature motif containing protein [Gordonia aquimaris]
MFTFTDRAADDALLASSSLDELAQHGRDLLRLSNQAQAIAMQIARQIGQSTYNERLAGYNDFVPNRIRNAADKAAKGEISLQLGISRRQAGEWVSLDELLDEHPKIRDAFRAGDLRPHRLGVAIRGAATGPTGDLRARLADLADNAETTDETDTDTDNVDEELTLDLDDPAADLDPDTDDDGTDGEGSDDAGDAASETDPAATDDPAGDDDDEDEPWDFDDVVLDLASRPTTDTALRDDLDAIIISLDPDRAAQTRDDIADLFGDVTIGNEAFGHMTVDACIPAEHGVHLRDRISALISRRVCRRDGRSIKAQRVAAFAEIIKAPGAKLRCHCGDDTCPARQTRTNNPAPATAPTPSAGDSNVSDSAVDEPAMGGPDAAEEQPITLADIDNHSDIDGDGDSNGESGQSDTGIDADDEAEHVAPPQPRRDFITAPRAEHDTDVADAEATDDSDADIEDTTAAEAELTTDTEEAETTADAEVTDGRDDDPTDTDTDTDSDLIVPGLTLLRDPTGLDPTRLMGYGAIDPAHAARIAPHATTVTARPSETRTASGLIIFGNRTPAPPIDLAGHGGFTTPPPGALTYTPSAALRAEIIQLDRRCRYPYCGRPSEECELDHLLKFCHADPLAGGWTVAFNLAPLCRPDHDRKHDGPWIPTMHTDRTITWRNARTGQVIVTYPR